MRPVDDSESPLVVVRTRQLPPMAFQIHKEEAEVHGYTRGCAKVGSAAWVGSPTLVNVVRGSRMS